MGNIVEEHNKRQVELNIRESKKRSEHKKFQETKRFIENRGVYNILKRTMTHLLPIGCKVDFFLNMHGGSYTDGKQIVVGLPQYWIGEEEPLIFSVLKALTGHETEHIVSSDFELFVDFQKKVADDFNKKYHISEYLGMKLGRHLLNSVEDGRIEKRLGNRMRGYVKHIQHMNAVIWDNQPVKGEDELQEFLFSMTSMCVCGLKSKDWNKYYKGTELDDLLDKVRSLIIKGINEPTAKGCAERTFEIYEIIAPKMAELSQKQQDAMDDMSMDFNFSGTTGESEGGNSDGFPGNNVSTHFIPEEDDSEQDDSNEGNEENKENKDNEGNEGNESDEDDEGDEGDDKGKDDKKDEDENDLTDNGEDLAKEEKDLVKDLLKGAKDNLLEEVESDIDQVENENLKIEREDDRKKSESGDLSDEQLEYVLSDRKVPGFKQMKAAPTQNISLPENISIPGKKLNRQLKKILMDKQGYTSRNRKRGVLDPTGIWRLGVKEYDTFIKKGKPDNSSYAVSVLVDNSGSMLESGDHNHKEKIHFAKEACAILEEGLKGLVPHRIIQFDYNHHEGVCHRIIADFGDTENSNRTWLTRLRPGAANADSISIRIAAEELSNRKESKKILFVLSDGLPSAYFNEKDAVSSVRNAVRDARKKGIIVVAICFGDQRHLDRTRGSYHKMYQSGIVMTEPENIPAQLVKVLEREIK